MANKTGTVNIAADVALLKLHIYKHANIAGQWRLLESRGAGCAQCSPGDKAYGYDKLGRLTEQTVLGQDGNPISATRTTLDIPEDVLQEIRARGGALRLKFRLKTDGVLFGWDIERHVGAAFTPLMPGGDFLEMKY